jgi:hypothetical protein
MAGVTWVTGLRCCPEFRPVAPTNEKTIEVVHVNEDHTLMPGASTDASMNHADARARRQAELQARDKPWTCAKRKIAVTKARCVRDKIAAVGTAVKGHPCLECGLPLALKWVTRDDLARAARACERGAQVEGGCAHVN